MKPDQPNRQQDLAWYLSLVVLVLFVVVPPVLFGLFYLSQVPDITWERDDQLTFDRIWLHRDRRPAGIGYQSRRVVEQYSDTAVCVENKLRFLLWRQSSTAQPATTTQKMVRVGKRWQVQGDCP
ncbi:MAG: hypothetical protein D6784_13710 [Chloroflexi bacterium]|nr:MAG: hypothetical protein D6784_13710 [Chloroflexota bacterium]